MSAGLRGFRRVVVGRLVTLGAVLGIAWVCSGAELSTLTSGSWASVGTAWSGRAWLDLSPAMADRALQLAAQTLAVALWGTALGAVAGFGLSLGASERIVFGSRGPRSFARRGLVAICRMTLDVLRAVPDFAWALGVMVVVGPGPITGVLAIAVSVTGMLGRSYSQLYDTVDPLAVRAAEVSVGSRLLVAMYGYVPASAPSLLSYTLLRLECSVRNASVIGIVGGGGLGAALFEELGFGRYDRVATLLLTLLLLTGGADLLTKRLAAGLATRRLTRSRMFAVGMLLLAVASVPLWPNAAVALDELRRVDMAFIGQTFNGLVDVTLTMGGLQRLSTDAGIVVGVAITATALAVIATGAIMLAVAPGIGPGTRARRLLWALVDGGALVCRGIPDVAWLLLFSIVFSVSATAAILAIAVHSLGLLLRLFVETADRVPSSKRALGRLATPRVAALWVVWPEVAPVFWTHVGVIVESNLRAGVVVGIVGAGGLGDAFHTSLAFWRLGDATLQLAAMVVLSVLADRAARAIISRLGPRRSDRRSS